MGRRWIIRKLNIAMKKIILILCMFIGSVPLLTGQTKYSTKTGSIGFEASVPSFEEVKGANTNVSAILNCDTAEFAALALVKGFRFKVALMEEHFNENYIESSKFPKAIVRGTLKNFDFSELSTTPKEYELNGTINLHGQEQPLSIPIMVQRSLDGAIQIAANFTLNPEAFQIKIPGIVRKKVAEEVNVSVLLNLSNN
jgi:polyisoprenoid-binding protein YceI